MLKASSEKTNGQHGKWLKRPFQSVLFTDFQRISSLAVGKTASYIRDIAAAPL